MRWLLLCFISVGYAQVLPYTDVNSTNAIALTNKTLDCSLNTCLNIPSGSVNWAVPGTIGSTTPNTGAFTTLSASGAVSGAGFSTYLASPPAIGGTAPAAGAFTTLTSSSGMPLTSLASQATNTVLGNATSGSAVPSALAVGGCSSSTSALIWTTNTGFGCNTSINAATLGGATFAAPGAIGGGTAAAGTFTVLTGTSGSIGGLTAFGIRDTSAAFDVTLAAVSNTALTAGRTLTFNMQNVAHTLAFSATANTITFPNTSSYTLIGSGDSGTVTNTMLAGSITLANLATQATNTVVGNATNGSAVPTALAVGGCSTSASALIWTTNTGFGCNTSINAGTLGGATFASPAAIGSGTPAAGNFTTLGSSGLLSPAAGITATGGVINLNASSNNAVNIGTGTTTSTVTLGQNTASPGAVAILGPVSFQAGTAFTGATWGLTSPVWNGAAMTLNDTTASGTVTNDAGYTIQAVNFTSTGGASTTITNASGLWVAAPTCTTVVCTSKWAINTAGSVLISGALQSSGNAVTLNNNSNFAVNIGTGTDNALVTIGGGSNGIIMNAGLATGYVKNTGFISVGTKFTLSGGSGSCSSTSTTVGGAAAGSFVCSGTAGAGAIVITINGATGLAAPNGWACSASDITSGTIWTQSGTATTTCTIKGTTAANTDVIAFHAMGY